MVCTAVFSWKKEGRQIEKGRGRRSYFSLRGFPKMHTAGDSGSAS
jgi:hypothetical protein